jgi:chromosome segregation ATPase
VLYLAEVQKKSGGVFGGNKAELKLLACQRGEQNWSAVPGEEVIAAPEDANKFGDGALVLVELTANRQVQRIESGRQLVGILQNYSRQQEKFKNKEEEIEQWKESLTYQAQELNRREMEIQARQEQLEQLEQEIDRLEQRRNEIDGSREESERLKEEIERNRQELEGAWDHLRGEMRRLEERQAQVQQVTGPVLDEQQARQIQEILNGLSGAVASPEPIWEQLNLALEIVAAQQGVLDQHWGQLEQQRGAAQNQQGEVDRQATSIQERWGMWQQAQDSLLTRRTELKGLQDTLALKQEYAQSLSLQLRSQDDLIGEVQRLVAMSSDVKLSQQIDIATLERMPLGDLQAIVQNRQQELERAKSFVRDQEEELGLQQQMLDEIQKAIQQANDQERQNLQTELSDEQDRYQMLEESLLGCRRTLREREEIFAEHMKVLRRRQGMDDTDGGENQKIDLGPILRQLESSRQQQGEELQKLEREIEQKRSSIQQAQGMVEHQTQEQENQRQELKQLEQNLQAQRTAAAELLGRVKLYEEMLQPMQDKLNELKQKLDAIAQALNQIQECGNYQRWAVGEMGQIFMTLMSNQSQQLAAS